jgi:hypothetical protein
MKMKNYTKPEVNITYYETENIMLTSGVTQTDITALKVGTDVEF